MIDLQTAVRLARNHAQSLLANESDYTMTILDPKECDAGWIFKYVIICTSGIPPEEQEDFGGPPGCIVHRSDGSVEDLLWGDEYIKYL